MDKKGDSAGPRIWFVVFSLRQNDKPRQPDPWVRKKSPDDAHRTLVYQKTIARHTSCKHARGLALVDPTVLPVPLMPDHSGAVRLDSEPPDFALALPTSLAYATLPVAEAFSWDACATLETAGEWYLVVFRSLSAAPISMRRSSRRPMRPHTRRRWRPKASFITSKGHWLPIAVASHSVSGRRAPMPREAAGKPAHLAALLSTERWCEHYILEFIRVTKARGAGNFEFAAYDRPVPTA